ncbi:regulatory protein RecX [Paenibacillus radicis (ex Xue et al. 2023)]|uniref:Regulatory protein RecX n=1 Tax=Paenibacillus radicis (ex Xue et al. 2023) TaxID=2972489 RepID=A0ABT1YE85_9BACL|nr:RecX family transcriptional regulator [Paenibacillus radicis (ex Xue et al. 2023)]MCR8630734.1 RecX family transcriptional regulator [Paenibacillus radicis (ex Xue et al. 2023)]
MENEMNLSGTITKVERQKKSKDRYNLYIDELFACSLHEDILIKYRLVKGTRVSIKEMNEIAQAEDKQRAYLDAVRLLASRLRSQHELANRLKQKGYEPPLIAATMDRLKQEQYIDDQLFADQLTKQRIQSQKKGRNWVKQELRQKGVKPEQITQALDQIDEDAEYRSALDLGAKKYHSEANKDVQKAKSKVMMFLQRRGYSLGTISRVMKTISSSADFDEEHLIETDDFDY